VCVTEVYMCVRVQYLKPLGTSVDTESSDLYNLENTINLFILQALMLLVILIPWSPNSLPSFSNPFSLAFLL
jgi:hypothetical protein